MIRMEQLVEFAWWGWALIWFVLLRLMSHKRTVRREQWIRFLARTSPPLVLLILAGYAVHHFDPGLLMRHMLELPSVATQSIGLILTYLGLILSF